MNHPQPNRSDTIVSRSKKIRHYRQRQPNNDEKNYISHEVRKGHQPEAAEQWNEAVLFFSINEVRKTDRSEQHSPK